MSIQKKIWLISGSALLLSIVSAVSIDNIGMAGADGHADWSNFGKAMWLTVLITVPAFSVFFVSTITGLILLVLAKNKKP